MHSNEYRKHPSISGSGTRQRLKMKWNDWLQQSVEWKHGLETMPRWKAIRRFVEEGLVPFVKSHGYSIRPDLRSLTNCIATGLYENEAKSTSESSWNYQHHNITPLEEDETQWYFVLGPQEWAAFWAAWGQWVDISEESWRGRDRQIDIEAFIWTQIDLLASRQTAYVNSWMEYDEEGLIRSANMAATAPQQSAREDIYLREAAESGEWGGYRRTS